MLEWIRIKNFQSHKDTYVEFTNGVNSIIGESDRGKSSIKRAIEFVINNEPSGSSFLSHWIKELKSDGTYKFTGDCVVECSFNGTVVKRVKGKSGNKYFLNDTELSGFGQDVPDEVKELFNFSDVNIQHQHDSHFLLSDTAGQVARKLNKIVDMTVLDTAQQAIDRKCKQISREKDNCNNEIEDLTNRLNTFSYLDTLESFVAICEELEKACVDSEGTVNALSSVISSVEELYAEKALYGALALFSDALDTCESLNTVIKDSSESYAGLQSVLDNISLLETEKITHGIVTALEDPIKDTEIVFDNVSVSEKFLSELGSIIKEYVGLETELESLSDVSNVDVCELSTLVSDISKLESKCLDLNSVVDSYDKCNIELRKAIINRDTLERGFKNNFPEVCPLCGKENKNG